MKFTKLRNSRAQVNVNIIPYLVDWNYAVSKPQKKVKDFLFKYWKGHVCLEEFTIPGSRLRVDIINITRRIAVEVSPAGTHSFSKFFHKTKLAFGAAVNRELDKAKWLEQNQIKLIEIFDDDIDNLSKEWFKIKYDVEL